MIAVLVEGGAGGFGGGQPTAEVGLHAADPLLVGPAVQAESARRAHRLEQAVAALPRAQQVLADSEPPRELVAALFGLAFGETNVATRIVYALVGLSAVYQAAQLPATLRHRTSAPSAVHA